MRNLLFILVIIFFLPVLCLAENSSYPAPSEDGMGQGTLPRTGQIGCFDDKGAAVEFKGSGQDGEQQRGLVWPTPRFIVNDDGTVTDGLTGLIWLINGDCFKKLNWLAAKEKIVELNTSSGVCQGYKGNYKDWRLPDLKQLASLLNLEYSASADYLRSQGFHNVLPDSYWTSSQYQNLLTAWTVNLGDGTVKFQEKLANLSLLPVRRSSSTAIKTQSGEKRQDGEAVTRFVNNGDGTVTDLDTGLMWLKNSSCLPRLDWQNALDKVKAFNQESEDICNAAGKYHDWVLPNRLELASLVDYGRDYPAVYPRLVFNEKITGKFWSSTTFVATPQNAYIVNFDDGSQTYSDKHKKHNLLLVRRVDLSPLPIRLDSAKAAGNLNVNPDFILALAPELHTDIAWPPEPRFLDNGDGTSMDRLTGITWLTDGNCFGRNSWQESLDIIKEFNSDPREFKCKGYEVSFGDWQMPEIADMQKMLNPEVDDSAAWLNNQGLVNLQAGGDYWSKSETLINLYYALVLRFKGDGKIMPYPKSLKFFLWPHRMVPHGTKIEPFINLTVNAASDAIVLSRQNPISLVVFIHTFALTFPADFWLWYDTPDGKKLWLSGIRTWRDNVQTVYQGALFNMRNYEIFRSPANNLAPGKYVFHFAIDATPDGKLDNTRYEVKVPVEIKAENVTAQLHPIFAHLKLLE